METLKRAHTDGVNARDPGWEERYRDIIATVHEGILLHDLDGVVVFANESATRILGVSGEQMRGTTLWHSPWTVIHEDGTPFLPIDLPTVITLRTAVAQSNIIMGIVRGNGTVAWVTTNCTLLTHRGADTPYGVATSFVNITEWKHTREALRESEERARQALAITALLALSFDAKETLAQITRQGALLLRADVCAVRLIEGDVLTIAAAHGTETAALQEATITVDDRISQVVCRQSGPVAIPSSGKALPDALAELIEPTGYRAYLGVPLHSESENMLGVLELYAADERAWTEPDIDLLKTLATAAAVALRNNHLYEEARRERERSEAIIAEIGDGIYQTDAHGIIAVWNPAAEMITGYAAKDVIGLDIADVLVRETKISTLHSIGRTLLHTRTSSDEDLWLDILIAPLHDQRNRVAGIVATFRDHTAERELDQLKSDFVSTVSHELRTPLTSIYGFAKTLVRTDAVFSPADQRTFLEVIATQAEHVTELVNDLLSVTRLEAGQFKLHLAPCDLRDAVPEAVESVRTIHPQILLDIEFLDAPSPYLVRADPDRLRQILLNLIGNAAKYSPDGGQIVVTVRPKTETVEVEVRDEGIGISRADRKHLFEKFFRADAGMRRGIGGTGLGLYITRSLITQMAGRIWVESEEGIGSTFIFELPKHDQAG